LKSFSMDFHHSNGSSVETFLSVGTSKHSSVSAVSQWAILIERLGFKHSCGKETTVLSVAFGHGERYA
jgi:hypothetical protein